MDINPKSSSKIPSEQLEQLLGGDEFGNYCHLLLLQLEDYENISMYLLEHVIKQN